MQTSREGSSRASAEQDLVPLPVAIRNNDTDTWHFGARYPNGPVLSAEECNLDDAVDTTVYPLGGENGDFPTISLCGHCAEPVRQSDPLVEA